MYFRALRMDQGSRTTASQSADQPNGMAAASQTRALRRQLDRRHRHAVARLVVRPDA